MDGFSIIVPIVAATAAATNAVFLFYRFLRATIVDKVAVDDSLTKRRR